MTQEAPIKIKRGGVLIAQNEERTEAFLVTKIGPHVLQLESNGVRAIANLGDVFKKRRITGTRETGQEIDCDVIDFIPPANRYVELIAKVPNGRLSLVS